MGHNLFLIIVPLSVVIALAVVAFSHFTEKAASSSTSNRHLSRKSAMTVSFKNQKPVIAGTLGFIFLFITIFCSVYTVDEGEKAVVLRFGEIFRTADPGLHFKVPFIDSVKRYSTRVQKTTFGTQEPENAAGVLSAYSYDQQIIESYRISVTWIYNSGKISEVYKYFGAEQAGTIFANVVAPLVQQSTKAILGRYTAQTIVQNRAKLDNDIETTLREQLRQYPINIISIQFEDINFSASYEKIIEETAQKKQEVEKAKNELERIQIEAQQQVAQAEAKNRAVRLQADAEAYRRKVEADADAYKTKVTAEAVAYQIKVKAREEAAAITAKGKALKENERLIDLFAIEKWDGSVPETVVQSDGQSLVPLLNIKRSKD